MRRRIPLLLLVPLAMACPKRPVPSEAPEPVTEASPSRPPEERPSLGDGEEPTIRVGLSEDASQLVVGCDGPLQILGRDSVVVARMSALERLELSVEGVVPEASFTVQLQSLTTDAAARESARRAETIAQGWPVQVQFDPDTGRFRVRVGPLPSREIADALKSTARSGGWEGAFVVPGPLGPASQGHLRARLGSRAELPALTRVRLHAPDGSPIHLLGAAYEGDVEVFVNRSARLTVVNELPLEQYLRGVVPNELGPAQYPNLEAIKAQAVAARTYAWGNLSRFRMDGFDICATPRCQVYRGVETHHPVSDRAIEETRGVIATFQGEPIRALFTSTCGGRTENVEEVFRGDAAPYLVGVSCEAESASAGPTALRSERFYAEDGDLVNEELTLGRLAGLPWPERPVRAWLERSVTSGELQLWIAAAQSIAGATGGMTQQFATTRDGMARAIVEGLGLTGRVAILQGSLASSDLLAVARDAAEVGDPEAWVYLLEIGALAPYPDGSLHPAEAPSRAVAIRALTRVLVALGRPNRREATYRSHAEGWLTAESSGAVHRWPIGADAAFYRDVRGEAVPVDQLPLRGGDRLELVLRDGRIAFMKGVDLGKGTHYDRFSRYSDWEVTYLRTDLQERLATRFPLEELVDLEVVRRSPSGRVAELRLRALPGDHVLTGLDIRFGLGVRENLFRIEREYEPSGVVRAFRFVGRGFGHGVGLCQVGAYGMGLSGHSFDEILTHYYRGIELTGAY